MTKLKAFSDPAQIQPTKLASKGDTKYHAAHRLILEDANLFTELLFSFTLPLFLVVSQSLLLLPKLSSAPCPSPKFLNAYYDTHLSKGAEI